METAPAILLKAIMNDPKQVEEILNPHLFFAISANLLAYMNRERVGKTAKARSVVRRAF